MFTGTICLGATLRSRAWSANPCARTRVPVPPVPFRSNRDPQFRERNRRGSMAMKFSGGRFFWRGSQSRARDQVGRAQLRCRLEAVCRFLWQRSRHRRTGVRGRSRPAYPAASARPPFARTIAFRAAQRLTFLLPSVRQGGEAGCDVKRRRRAQGSRHFPQNPRRARARAQSLQVSQSRLVDSARQPGGT